MNCRLFSMSLRDYISDELSGELNEVMASHIARCESCRKKYNEQLEVYKSIQGMTRVQEGSFRSSRAEIMLRIDKDRYGDRFISGAYLFIRRYAIRVIAASAVVVFAALMVLAAVGSLENIIAKQNNTAVSAPVKDGGVKKQEENTNLTYKNERLGFLFSVKEDWVGKYTIFESDEGIYVFFDPSKTFRVEHWGSGQLSQTIIIGREVNELLFSIVKKSEYIKEGFLDSVRELRTVQAKGDTYVVSCPTDVNFQQDNPEFNDFTKLQKEVDEVVSTIKVIDADK